MMVKNEDRFVWFAINSVLPFADKLLIYDSGSNDNTVEIIKSIKSKKINFEIKKIKDRQDVAVLRNEQINKTSTPWIWVVDGDEVYPSVLCREIRQIIEKRGMDIEGIVVGRFDLLGDIYHYQDESVGSYELFGQRGHFAIRLINKEKIKNLHVEGLYPYEGYYDGSGVEIIHHDSKLYPFSKGKLFHAMYLNRSSKGTNLTDTFHRRKWKIEIGHKFDNQTKYPEVFSNRRPKEIYDVTKKRTYTFELLAALITPVKRMKRRIFN